MPNVYQVSSDGKVTEPPMAQLTYGALIGGRVQMVMGTTVRCEPRAGREAIMY